MVCALLAAALASLPLLATAPAAAQQRVPARGPAQPQLERPRGLLAEELTFLMNDEAVGRSALWGALVVSLTHGDTLFAWRSERRFIPASNAKLFTTAAALHYLGTDFRFITVLYPDGRIRNGELDGDLVLYGTGDPSFALDTASLYAFADSVVLAGIRRVRGALVADASFLGGDLRGPGWEPDNLTSQYAARPAALGAFNNRVRLLVQPAMRAGEPARVRMEPSSDYHTISGAIVTGRPGSRTSITVRRGAGRVIELRGTISPDDYSWERSILVEEPAFFTAALLRELLVARGVAIAGPTRLVTDNTPTRAHAMLTRSAARGDPFTGAIAVRRSPELAHLISMINHRSHNLSAELAFRTVGRMQGGTGTFASGARAVARFLTDEVGISSRSIQVTDGSGLSVLDLASPLSLVQLLAYMRTAPEGREFYESLPVVGYGLRPRMSETTAFGRLRAKTGTLGGVSSLSGYVTTAGGEELAFALIANSVRSVDAARAVQDSIGARLAAFRRTGDRGIAGAGDRR
jgi:D-alanyl-D-alanine carboxypeptidase/D-alanyl-D-alanine-endopeptidase (penicillin-binding protein 4)